MPVSVDIVRDTAIKDARHKKKLKYFKKLVHFLYFLQKITIIPKMEFST